MNLNFYEVVVLANAQVTRHGICTKSARHAQQRFQEQFRERDLRHHRVVSVKAIGADRWSELMNLWEDHES